VKETGATLIAALRPSIRAAVAAGLAVALAQLLQLPFPLYAMIAAVIVTDLSAARTRRLGFLRLVGTVLGASLGALMAPLLPPGTWWGIGLGVLAAMFLSRVLHLQDADKVTGYVTGIVLLHHGDHPWIYAFHRTVETVLGIGLAMLVGLVPLLISIEEPKPPEAGSPEPRDRRAR
jgi:uncharacterized membrane protein YgaE (UPF0421/DUF939 family)